MGQNVFIHMKTSDEVVRMSISTLMKERLLARKMSDIENVRGIGWPHVFG